MFETLAPSFTGGASTSGAAGGRADASSPFNAGGFNVSFGGQSAGAMPTGTQAAAGWPGVPTAARYTFDTTYGLPKFSTAAPGAASSASGFTLSPAMMAVGGLLLLMALRKG
jgi:hypothetical protein